MKVELANLCAFLLALALATLGASGLTQDGAAQQTAPARPTAAPELAQLPDGTRALADARGTLVPLAHYRRIASGTVLADRLLVDLCEPARVAAFSRYGAATPHAHRYAGKPTISAREDLERVLALRPDLLLVSDLVDASYVARLRERGVRVFDLGPMRGLSTLLPTIQALGLLLGAPERAQRYASTLLTRMRAVAASVPAGRRPHALYLSLYGDRLFGAGDQTSYHDVLEYAGLRDAAAAGGLSGWPELSAERVLALDPEVILTRSGMAATLCRHPGLASLRPCRREGRIVELPGALLDDPGPGLLEATEALRAAYWHR